MQYHNPAKESDRPVVFSLASPKLGLKLQWSTPTLALPLVPSPPRASNPMSRWGIKATAAVVLLFAQTCAARGMVEKRDPTFGFPYGSTKIRGVNLG